MPQKGGWHLFGSFRATAELEGPIPLGIWGFYLDDLAVVDPKDGDGDAGTPVVPFLGHAYFDGDEAGATGAGQLVCGCIVGGEGRLGGMWREGGGEEVAMEGGGDDEGSKRGCLCDVMRNKRGRGGGGRGGED